MIEGAQAHAGLDYEVLEAAVLESSRGRWFLEEYSRRRGSADTRVLLDAINRLESLISARPAGPVASAADRSDLISLMHAIRKTRAEMAAVRNHLLPDGGAIEDSPAIYGKLAETAKAAADHLMGRTESLQQTTASLKAADPSNPFAARIEQEVSGLQNLAWTQDVLSQRVAKSMGILSHLDDRLSVLTGEAPPSESRPAEPTKANMAYYAQDEDIFAPPKASAEAKPPLKVVAPAAAESSTPPAPPAPRVAPLAETGGRARVMIKRYSTQAAGPASEAGSASTPATPQPPTEAAPAPAAQRDSAPERKRVIIVRRKSGETADIPLARETPATAVG
jgi:hypothetical protein